MSDARPTRRRWPRRRMAPACLLALLIGAGLVLGVLATHPSGVAGADSSFDARLRELRIVSLGGRIPRSFALPALDARRFTLGQLTGRAAFLYFWATW